MQRGKTSLFTTFGGHLGFLTCRVVEEYPVQRGKISIFATFGGHLGFLRKVKNCEYLGKGISSPLMLGGRCTPR